MVCHPVFASTYTQAISVIAVVRSSELLSAMVIRSLMPSNCMALPNRPLFVRVGPVVGLSVPLLPFPLLSTTVLPLASSKPYDAPLVNGFTVTVALHEDVWLAESVTFSVTVVCPPVYGPGGTWASVTGPPSGSYEPLLIDAICVPRNVAVTVTFWQTATGTGSTIVIVKVCGAVVSDPPFAVPPLSTSLTVTVATPAMPAAGV